MQELLWISVLSIPGKAQKMKYLGSASDEDGSCEAEVDHRIGAASKVVGALRRGHRAKRIEQGN